MRLSVACASFALVTAGGLVCASDTFAASITLRAELKGANVVPPNEAGATGHLAATFDTVTRKLTWTGAHSGLSSKIRGTHFHGPAGPNETAGVAESIRSLSAGSATLTDKEAADLIAGNWYVDIHTRSYGRGEIRGQLVRGK